MPRIVNDRIVRFEKRQECYCAHFFAMASDCEIIIESLDVALVHKLGDTLAKEVWRIQDKYSRYDTQSACSKINSSVGLPIAIDIETFLLLDFANTCYDLSDGLFDITSGVLRKAWNFDCSENIPTKKEVSRAQSLVGWPKVKYDQSSIILPKGMQLDFGGIGKEYAVDKAIVLAKQISSVPVLVNLGGDLAVTSERLKGETWKVAIEHPDATHQQVDLAIALKTGALATSGDAKRYLLKSGKRYSHVLNAKTGWPIENAPRSITVVAPQCIQAGILATLALLQGDNAENFLNEQKIKFWARR